MTWSSPLRDTSSESSRCCRRRRSSSGLPTFVRDESCAERAGVSRRGRDCRRDTGGDIVLSLGETGI